MHVRPSEAEQVASGLGLPDRGMAAAETLGRAFQKLALRDRPPAWELAVRHYGHGKSLEQAAGEVGLDLLLARDITRAVRAALGLEPAAT